MLRIYLANLGKYNEGELIGEWLNLPCTDDELEKVKERIGISDEPDENGIYYEEWFITDYETDINGLEIGEYDSLDELNELAENLDNFDESELKALQAYLMHGDNIFDAVENVKGAEYFIYSGCDTMEEVAKEIIEANGMLDNVPEEIARYFDYEAYGRDLDIEGYFYNIDGDIVEIIL